MPEGQLSQLARPWSLVHLFYLSGLCEHPHHFEKTRRRQVQYWTLKPARLSKMELWNIHVGQREKTGTHYLTAYRFLICFVQVLKVIKMSLAHSHSLSDLHPASWPILFRFTLVDVVLRLGKQVASIRGKIPLRRNAHSQKGQGGYERVGGGWAGSFLDSNLSLLTFQLCGTSLCPVFINVSGIRW